MSVRNMMITRIALATALMLVALAAAQAAEELPAPAVAQAEATAAAKGQKPDLLGDAGDKPAGYTSLLGRPPALNQKQQAAVDLSTQAQGLGKPMLGPDGSVVYVFGFGAPEVVCSPLNLCDIELEKGEQITSNPSAGDQARWLIQFIPGTAETSPHLVVKPNDVGIETSLIVPTNRRTYHLHLISDAKKYTSITRFAYPEALMAQTRQQAEEKKATEAHLAVTPFPGGRVLTTDQLNFHYKISGKAQFNPVRVYNDGQHTIIQLPPEVRSGDAPILMLANRDAPSSVGPTAAVNYRLVDDGHSNDGPRFIVDSVFREAELISGVGSRAKIITITYLE